MEAELQIDWRLGNDRRCSFCQRSKDRVRTLVSNPAGTLFICDECIAVCSSIIDDHKAGHPTGSSDEMKKLALGVYNHCNPHVQRLIDSGAHLAEVTVLITGPGMCRMWIARTLTRILRVPCSNLHLPVPLYLTVQSAVPGEQRTPSAIASSKVSGPCQTLARPSELSDTSNVSDGAAAKARTDELP